MANQSVQNSGTNRSITLQEIEAGMIVELLGPGNGKSRPMEVSRVSRYHVVGWQEAVDVALICCGCNRRHQFSTGVNDFLQSGNQLHLIARP